MAAEITREELLLLGRCPFFRGADEALLRRVLALPGVTAEAFSAGETVYQPHQFRRCLGFLLAGQVQVTNAALSVSVLEAGELFGAAALYNDLPDYATTLTARTNCRILFLPQEDVDRLLGRGTPPPPELPALPVWPHPVPVRAAGGPGPDRCGRQAGPVSPLQRGALGPRPGHRFGQAAGPQPGLPLPGLRGPGVVGPHPPGGQDGVRAGPRGAGRGFVSVLRFGRGSFRPLAPYGPAASGRAAQCAAPTVYLEAIPSLS